MKNIIKRTAALLTAIGAIMTAGGCGSKDPSSSGSGTDFSNKDGNMVASPNEGLNIAAEDMPVGSSQKELFPDADGVPIGISYISSQISIEEAKLLCEYFYAVSEKDGARLKACYYQPYFDKYVSSQGLGSEQEFAQASYDLFKVIIGEEYNFNYIIEDSIAAGYDYESYDNMLKDADPGAAVEDKKVVFMEASGETPTNAGFSLEVRFGNFYPVCIYKIAGQYYIM